MTATDDFPDQELDLDWLTETMRLNGEEEPPERLFKYLDVDSKYFALTLHELLLHSRVRLSAPGDFNDPFDAQVALRVTSSEEAIAYFRGAWHRAEMNSPYATAEELEADAVPMQYRAHAAVLETFRRLGIYSLSSRRDHPLMWAHYASSHRGIVLEFHHVGEVWGAAYPVRYQDEFPTIAFTPNEKFRVLAAIKGMDWRYEREWRLVEPRKARQWIDSPPASIRAITFGAKCSEADRAAIFELLERRQRSGLPFVEVHEVILAANRFEMTFREQREREVRVTMFPDARLEIVYRHLPIGWRLERGYVSLWTARRG